MWGHWATPSPSPLACVSLVLYTLTYLLTSGSSMAHTYTTFLELPSEQLSLPLKVLPCSPELYQGQIQLLG